MGRGSVCVKMLFYLHQVSVDNVLLGKQPVFHLLLVHGRHQAELAEVLAQELVHHRHVLLGHRPQTLSFWSLIKMARFSDRKEAFSS